MCTTEAHLWCAVVRAIIASTHVSAAVALATRCVLPRRDPPSGRRVERNGRPLCASVQATFNLLDQSAAPALEAAAQAGAFVIVKEALANGRLTSRAQDPRVREVLLDEAAALRTTPDALALAWVLSHSWVGMVLSGASSAPMLRENADALRIAPLDGAVMQRLGESLVQGTDEYWADRRALAWN